MLMVFFLTETAGRIDTSRDTEYPWTWSARMPHFSRSWCKRKSACSKASNRQMTQCQMVLGGGSSSGASGNVVSKCEGNGVFSKDSQKLAPCDCTCGVEMFNMEHVNSSSHVQAFTSCTFDLPKPARPTPWVASNLPKWQLSRPHRPRTTSPSCATDCWAIPAIPCCDHRRDLKRPSHP